MSNSGSQKFPVDTVEKLLQLTKNDLEAFKKVQFETIDGVQTAVDPDQKTPMTTSGINKLSFDKEIVGKKTTDGGKSTPPYFSPEQTH